MSEIHEEVQLSFDLPEAWAVDTVTEFATDAAAMTNTPAAVEAIRRSQNADRPFVTASLFAVLTSDEEVNLVVTASVVASTLPIDEIFDAGWAEDRRIERSVICAPGITADFFQMIVIKRDERRGLAALFLFTTPNLTLADEMSDGFAAIAATAKFVPRSSETLAYSV